MDYIKRKDALTDAMCVGISCQECPFLIHPVNGGCKIENYMKSIPAADVVERKKGKWIEVNVKGLDYVYCSECEDSYYPTPIDPSWYFCPHCGADMREATDE